MFPSARVNHHGNNYFITKSFILKHVKCIEATIITGEGKEATSVIIFSWRTFMSCYKYVNGILKFNAPNNFDFYTFCHKATLITKKTCRMICCWNDKHYTSESYYGIFFCVSTGPVIKLLTLTLECAREYPYFAEFCFKILF